MALAKKNRLKSRKEFDRVFKKGGTIKGDFLFLKFIKSGSLNSRFGVIVPSKIIKLAVERNKIKRLILEAIRLKDKKSMEAIFTLIKKPTTVNFKNIKEEVDKILDNVKIN